MARQVVITDDITGEPGAETHVLTIDGAGVEIDLTEKSMEKLLKVLAPFLNVGTQAEFQVTRHERGKRKVNGQQVEMLDTNTLIAYVQSRPQGVSSADLAAHFGVSNGTIVQRLKSKPEVRKQQERTPGQQGPGQNVWYPA